MFKPIDRSAAHAGLDILLDELETYRKVSGANPTGMAMMMLSEAASFAGELVGEEALHRISRGGTSSNNRAEKLKSLARHLALARQMVALSSAATAIVDEALEELGALYRGDNPRLFAQLGRAVKPVRVARAKLMAAVWDAYLEGLGVPILERHAAISVSFGHEWDTISRWARQVEEVLGPCGAELDEARENGQSWSTLQLDHDNHPMPLQPTLGRNWREGVALAGQHYRAARAEKVNKG